MAFGLFGKLPQKRDFVSVNLPNSVLHPFETWLQSGVAASRNDIGRGWENYFLVSPIWHFWLGKEVVGTACAGSLMPSVDQVGRYFPLSIIYCAEPGEVLPPPLLDPMDDWYAHIDQRLLAVLGDDQQVEVSSLLTGLSRPGRPEIHLSARLEAPVAHRAPAATPEPPPAPPPPPAASAPAPTAPPPAAVIPIRQEPIAVLGGVPPATPVKSAGEAEPWDPMPMAPAALAAIRNVTAFEGVAADAVEEPTPEAPAEAPAPPPAGASAWDVSAPAVEAAPASAEPVESKTNGGVVDDWSAPLAAALPPAAEPAVSLPPAEAVTEPTPPPPPAPVALRPIAHVRGGEFKGGLLASVEPGMVADANIDLLELDYRHAAASRSYWWCGPSNSGPAQLHSRNGLPDPFFFSRMLMWTGK